MEKNLLLLIILAVLNIQADTEFIYSHKLRIENATVVGESIYISKAMTITNRSSKKECIIKDDRKKSEKTIDFLKRNSENLSKCFQKYPKIFNSYMEKHNNSIKEQITLKTIPVRFTVEFNNHFAIIKTFK